MPALLIGIVGWPLPRGLPSVEDVRTALDEGWRPDDRFVLGLLALLLWVLWAQVLRHVVGQVALQLRLRRAAALTGDELLPQVALTGGHRRGPVQRLVSWLVGGLMMASPLAPAAAMAAPAPRIPVVLTVTQAMADPLLGPAPASVQAPAASEVAAPTYMVHTWAERRDCLWNIAERYLGDPFRWTEIRDLNRDRLQPDGRRLGDDPSSWVYPGWELVLPSDAAGAEVVPAQPAAPPPSGSGGVLAPPVGSTPSLPTTAPAPPAAPGSTVAPSTTALTPTTAAPATSTSSITTSTTAA
ncbi:MAG TPA: hypothetical protein VG637_06480, partial [Actinomycetes bacterium]|nr:hypothetical protein [Actinomycetes bacterium]